MEAIISITLWFKTAFGDAMLQLRKTNMKLTKQGIDKLVGTEFNMWGNSSTCNWCFKV